MDTGAWRAVVHGVAKSRKRLSDFSFLLCGIAIPQSGLLFQVSSLRLPSGHSGPVLTLSNAARASLPTNRRLLVVGAGICTASPRGELPLGT